MVEIDTDDPEKLQAFAASLLEIKENAPGATEAIGNLKDSLNRLSPEVIKEKMSEAAETIKSVASRLSELTGVDLSGFRANFMNMAGDMIKSGEMTSDMLKNLAGDMVSLYTISTGRLELPKSLMDLGSGAAEARSQTVDLFDQLRGSIPLLKKLEEKFQKMGVNIRTVFEQADAANNLQTAFLRQASAAGELGDVLDAVGGNFERLENKIIDYSNKMSQAAMANNVSYDTVVRLNNVLREIPGALSTNIMLTDGAGTTMNMLDATLKVAAGTFQEHKDVLKDVNLVYQNFGVVGEDSLKFVSRMQRAAQALRLPMESMRGFVENATQSFKFLGDNTQAAINIMGQFAPALKESGLGPAGIRDIVSGIVRATSQLDVAQRAFLSAQTGGPGGLQGGYQIALDMQEGNMDAVFQRVKDSLMDMFGGDVVTLDEAATDSRAAAQMTRQVQMLTSGPLAIAGSEQEAFKIIDAFAKGLPPPDALSKLAVGKEGTVGDEDQALVNAVKVGNAIQDKQLNALNTIAIQLQNRGTIAALGVERRFVRNVFGQESELQDVARTQMTQASVQAAQGDIIADVPTSDLQQEYEKLIDSTLELANRGKEYLSNLPFMERDKEEEDTLESIDSYAQERLRKDIEASASEVRTPEIQRRSNTGGDNHTSTMIIQVRSDNEIRNMIKVYVDEHGRIVAHEEAATAHGAAIR